MINPLPSLIRASAQDAATAAMRKAGRSSWSRDDFNVAAETQERLIRQCYGVVGENDPNMCFIRFSYAETMERRGEFHLKSKLGDIHDAINKALA
jgi:hypothetical protein